MSNDDGSINEGCGALILGLTDGDGDFLTYNVEISGVELTRADGTQISVMPTSQRVDFVNYIELSELAATLKFHQYNQG